jgi:hypothetical protein
LDAQNGGSNDLYVFFLTTDKYVWDKNFKIFKNNLGPCTMYFRVGSASAPIDIFNTYNTVYPNESNIVSNTPCKLNYFKSGFLPIKEYKEITKEKLEEIKKEIKNKNNVVITKILIILNNGGTSINKGTYIAS